MLPPQDIQDRSKSSNPTETEAVHCIVYGGPNSFWVFFYRVASAVFRQPHYVSLFGGRSGKKRGVLQYTFESIICMAC